MCLNPRIIVNPRFVQLSVHGRYPMISMNGHDMFYSRNALDEFDYKRFSVKRNSVNKDNIDKFFAYNFDGETLPIFIEVSCGKCKPCIESKRASIKNRMILEQFNYENPPIFLTLTYDNSHLPSDGVSVDDVQLFLKRFRRYMEYHYPQFSKFRYVCFSEYGSLHSRPHYHLIIFGSHIGNESPRHLLQLESELSKCWGNGFIYAVLCDGGCFNYVSKYVAKGSNVPPGMNPNFMLSSRRKGGIGIPSIEQNEDLYYRVLSAPHPMIRLKVMGKVYHVYIPKSIRDRLFRSPRQIIKPNTIIQYKRFVYLSALLKHGSNLFPDFKSFFSDCLKLHDLPYTSGILPSEIFEKFGSLLYSPQKVHVPSYFANSNIWTRETLVPYVREYIDLYKILLKTDIDLDYIYKMQYLREKIIGRWNLSLVKFIEGNDDRDPLSVATFDAILVEAERSLDMQ